MLQILLNVPGRLHELLNRLTPTRAGYLDKLPKLDNMLSYPKCSVINVYLNHAGRAPAWKAVGLGYTAKNASRVALIPNVIVEYAGARLIPNVRLSSSRASVEIYVTANVNNSGRATGTVTVIDFQP